MPESEWIDAEVPDPTPMSQVRPGTAFAEGAQTLLSWVVVAAIGLGGVGLLAYLVIESFTVSADAGVRSICAAMLPILVVGFLRTVRPNWLRWVRRVGEVPLALGVALLTIIVTTIVTADPQSGTLEELAVSFLLAALWLTQPVSGRRGPFDSMTLAVFFSIAFGLAIALLFALGG